MGVILSAKALHERYKINPSLLHGHAPSRLLKEVMIYNQAKYMSDEINWDWDFDLI